MNGPIAQAVALVCHGNAALGRRPVARFWPKNSTAQFCSRVTFVTFARKLLGGYEEKEIASTPDDWFEYVARSDVARLSLQYGASGRTDIPDRMSAGFVGGGGNWSIATVNRRGEGASWGARWEVGDRSAPDRRIWRVTYGGLGESSPMATDTVDEVRPRLVSALEDIRSFAAEQNLAGFAECFEHALAALQGTARFGDHKDLVPDGLSSERVSAMLDACQSAWVFGGMGSWNDMGFEGELGRRYDSVSERLFSILPKAIIAATNEAAVTC